MHRFSELSPRLCSQNEESTLLSAIDYLKSTDIESLVQFLHITINNLCRLLVRPEATRQSFEISRMAFKRLGDIVNRVHNLDLQVDKHGRNYLLSSYIQYVFSAPVAQCTAEAIDSNAVTQSEATVDVKMAASLSPTKKGSYGIGIIKAFPSMLSHQCVCSKC